MARDTQDPPRGRCPQAIGRKTTPGCMAVQRGVVRLRLVHSQHFPIEATLS
jgi:hypothetical protein